MVFNPKSPRTSNVEAEGEEVRGPVKLPESGSARKKEVL